jgi:hypothetical protein
MGAPSRAVSVIPCPRHLRSNSVFAIACFRKTRRDWYAVCVMKTGILIRGCRRTHAELLASVFLIGLGASLARAQTNSVGINVELVPQVSLRLHVTLRSNSKSTARLSRSELPWGSQESMVLVAAIGAGRCLRLERPQGDPQAEPVVSLAPHESLSGDIDLEGLFPQIRSFLKESDVQLFWAYEAPETLHIHRWSGGWILIPKQP